VVARLFEDSGYLTMWKWDVEANPHWYDAAIFASSVPIREQVGIATDMALADEDALRRHQSNLASLISIQTQQPTQTTAMLITLEQKLCELCIQRLSVFKAFVAM
jgi:hypothetical protein